MKNIAFLETLIGLKEDGGGNNTFKESNPLYALLKDAGQKDGEAYCSYLQEAAHVKAYPEKEAYLRKVFSANCVQTAKNLVADGTIPLSMPRVGNLVIFADYKNGIPTGKGHMAAVSMVGPDGYQTIDGNTTAGGARETGSTGGVAKVNRKVKAFNPNGLNEIGFFNLGLE